MSNTAPSRHFLLLDSNALVAERLLLSTLGSALLHSAAKNHTTILLPEIVERETTEVLLRLANDAASAMQKSANVISQLANHPQSIIIPSQQAIAQAISERWGAISGIIERVPFTFDQAQFALSRILAKLPPCGPNNEQFRDCCIWRVALAQAEAAPVHLVSGDKAFYLGGTHANGMASNLRDDMSACSYPVTLHPTIGDYLRAVGGADTAIDEMSVAILIEAQLSPEASWIAHEKEDRPLTIDFKTIALTGFATPKPSAIAVSFEARYSVTTTDQDEIGPQDVQFSMRLAGSCSYDPTADKISDIEILEWSKNFVQQAGHRATHSPSKRFKRMFDEGNFRILQSGF
jgi:hypothetical protein